MFESDMFLSIWQVCGPAGEILLVQMDVLQTQKSVPSKSQQVFKNIFG